MRTSYELTFVAKSGSKIILTIKPSKWQIADLAKGYLKANGLNPDDFILADFKEA